MIAEGKQVSFALEVHDRSIQNASLGNIKLIPRRTTSYHAILHNALQMHYICLTHALHVSHPCITHVPPMYYTCLTDVLHMSHLIYFGGYMLTTVFFERMNFIETQKFIYTL